MATGIGFTIQGAGPEKVIVMHDWMGDSRNYEPIFPYLDRETFTYAFVDLRGYGKSKEILGNYTLQECVQDIRDLLTTLGWETFHIIGHSMSAMVAQKIAAETPNAVKSLIALTPVPASGLELSKEMSPLYGKLLEPRERFSTLETLWGNRYSKRWIHFKTERWNECSTIEANAGYLRMVQSTNFAKDVRGLATPTLVVIGEYDGPNFSLNAIKRTFSAWFVNVEFSISSNAGHYPMQEVPVYLVTTVEIFLNRNCG